MSSLAFRVHFDKENDTPAALMGKGAGTLKSFGPRQKQFVQPTPRKALFDVNNELQLSSNKFVRGKDVKLQQPMKKSSTSALRISKGGENTFVKKPELKNGSTNKIRNKTKGPVLKAPKVSSLVNTKPAPLAQHKLAPPVPLDEEYDSDSIFPRSERLSTYVGQLFSWRPPCLFGSIPDSEESDMSDDEDLYDILDLPVPDLPEVVEMDDDIFSSMVPLPVPEDLFPQPFTYKLSHDQKEAGPSGLRPIDSDLDTLPVLGEFDILPTPDTSLSLGSLHVMTGSLDVSFNDFQNVSLNESNDEGKSLDIQSSSISLCMLNKS